MTDKSNAMAQGHALWQRVFREVAPEFPDIQATHQYVDALVLQMVRDPAQFDVIVTNNLFGDIITDLGAALQGGLGMAASANVHPGRTSMFEPVHGSAPPLAGKNVANPMGAILSAGLMLAHLGLPTRRPRSTVRSGASWPTGSARPTSAARRARRRWGGDRRRDRRAESIDRIRQVRHPSERLLESPGGSAGSMEPDDRERPASWSGSR